MPRKNLNMIIPKKLHLQSGDEKSEKPMQWKSLGKLENSYKIECGKRLFSMN
jgi:hypothetical protein